MPRFFIAILFALCLCSCSRVEQARQVLHEADSLRAEGRLYPDSAVMAQTVKTLTPLRWAYPTQYANANYHYGRILRERSNYTDAMQCFINVIGSNSKDYQIKGRTYCNMGILCQRVGNYDLAYQMYVKSYDCFKLTGDTNAIFYAKDDIALALAKMRKKTECLQILDSIADSCNNNAILAHSRLMRAVMYRNLEQYDSAIIYANEYINYDPNETSALLIKAQSFSFLEVKDSAVYYAKKVVEMSNYNGDIGNAYYILQHDDTTISKDSVNAIAANRMDVQRLLDIRNRKIAQSVLLLKQYLNRKPDYRGWALLAAVFLTILIVALSWRRIARKRKLLRKEEAVNLQRISSFHENTLRMIEDNCKSLQGADLYDVLRWGDYEKMCGAVNGLFFALADKLRYEKQLIEKEVRLCVLVLIDDNYSSRQMSDLLIYSEKSVRGLKSKTAKKLGTDGKNMRNYLLNLAINRD